MTNNKLDYSITNPKQRVKIVKEILKETTSISDSFLKTLSDYLVYPSKNKDIVTPNRQSTISKRETSFEGLCSAFEHGEDAIYNLMSDLGKNTILDPKDKITQSDIDKSEDLQTLVNEISRLKEEAKGAVGKSKYLLKKQIIEMQQDQYVIRNDGRGKWLRGKPSKMLNSIAKLEFFDNTRIDPESGEPVNDGLVDLFNPKHVEAILCNYSALKEVSDDELRGDLFYLMLDFDNLCDLAIEGGSLLEAIMVGKVDGQTNKEIQRSLIDKGFENIPTEEYISSLWRKKIPRTISIKAKELFLIWYYTEVEKGHWKKCSRCGEIKLAHNMFFSKNGTSKDGYYSICKECRNRKKK